MKAFDAAGNESGSASVSVTTLPPQDTTAPATPVLLSPADGATVNTSQVSLDWSDVSDPSGVSYEVSLQGNPMATAVSNATTGTLSPGTYSWQVRAVDNAGNVGPWSSSRTFKVAFGIVTGTLPPASVGSPFSAEIVVGGGTAPYLFTISSGALPPGLSLSPLTGQIVGTPNAPGSYSFTGTVSDAAGLSASKTYTLEVTGTILPLEMTSGSSLPPASQGLSFAHLFEAAGGYRPYTWFVSSGSFPPGLSLSATTGLLHGVAAETGSFSFTLTLQDAAFHSIAQSFVLTVLPTSSTLTISSSYPMVDGLTQLPTIVTGAAFSTTFHATAAWSLSSGSLPAGMALDLNGGRISGVASQAGTYRFVLRALDSLGGSAYRAGKIRVEANGGTTLTLLSGSLAGGTMGVPYSSTLVAAGATAPYAWTLLAGSLPEGLTLDPFTGEIRGTPATGGTFTVMAQVSDSAAPTQTILVTISLNTGVVSATTETGGGESGGGGGGCGLVGLEAALLVAVLSLRRRRRNSKEV